MKFFSQNPIGFGTFGSDKNIAIMQLGEGKLYDQPVLTKSLLCLTSFEILGSIGSTDTDSQHKENLN